MKRALATMAAAAAAAATGCTYDDRPQAPGRYGGYAYDGREWAGPPRPYQGDLRGPGIGILDPWLRETPEGRAVVTLGFRDAAGGYVDEDVAHRANIWFRRYADADRDMRITDAEIRAGLVTATGRYVR